MSAHFSKKYYLHLLNTATENSGGIKFVDGVAMGLLLSLSCFETQEAVEMFEDWRITAQQMELKVNKRKVLYATYLSLVANAKDTQQMKYSEDRFPERYPKVSKVKPLSGDDVNIRHQEVNLNFSEGLEAFEEAEVGKQLNTADETPINDSILDAEKVNTPTEKVTYQEKLSKMLYTEHEKNMLGKFQSELDKVFT